MSEPTSELREALARAMADHTAARRQMEPLTDSQWRFARPAWLTDAEPLLPVVTAYAEQCVAEVAERVKAVPAYKVIKEDESLGYVVLADDVLDALASDDRTGQS